MIRRRILAAAGVTALAVAMAPALTASPASAVSSNAVVDFNDDGAPDYVIAAPGEAVSGHAGAGAVYVVYGEPACAVRAAACTTVHPNAAPAPQHLTQNTSGTSAGAEVGDRFGTTVETGDFDGDGITDLAVGSPFEDLGAGNSIVNAGGISLFYGSSGGLVARGGFTEASVGETIAANDRFGRALAAGDFDGDAASDLAVGVPGKTVDGATSAGEVDIFGGTSEGLIDDQLVLTENDTATHQPETGDGFGFALAAGNADGSAPDDLVIGAPFEDVEAANMANKATPNAVQTDAGLIWYIPGSAESTLDTTAGSTVTGADLPTTDDADNNITVVGLGSSLTLGNGQADVIVSGAPGSTVDPADNSAQLNAGIVAEIPVVGSGVGTNYEVYDQDSPGWPGGAETNDRFGASLAAGDWSGDGVDDYAIGIPGEALGSIANAGAIEVKNSDDPNQFISQNSGNVLGGAEANDGFGTALSSGDFTGDGIPDVAVGVPGETVGNGPAHAGIVQLFSGQDDSSGLPLTDTDQTAAFLGFTYSTNANFGAALVVGHGGLVL